MTASLSEVWSRLTAELLPVLSAYRAQLADLDVAVKADDTLLSEADIAVQERIVALISEYEPKVRLVAEEGGVRLDAGSAVSGRIWVIDPIDGTAEFVKPEGLEFCTVVTALSDGSPDACYVLAPELGARRLLDTRIAPISRRTPVRRRSRPAIRLHAPAPGPGRPAF